jgi:gamma-glutamylcyclotransferase (GGCT)/AIG2-like uncharacterized protein YtfP
MVLTFPDWTLLDGQGTSHIPPALVVQFISLVRIQAHLLMNRPCPYLFVYGTLRRESGLPATQILADHARYLGPSKTQARLYDLGRYPGMTLSASITEWVRGELYELELPEQTLADLDAYEGCDQNNPEPTLFERRLIPVVLASGERWTAWAYVYLGPVDEEQRIASGDYLASLR